MLTARGPYAAALGRTGPGRVGRPPPDRWPRRLEFVDGMSHSYQAAAVPAVGRALDRILGRDATAAA